jgi:hypothetical protein
MRLAGAAKKLIDKRGGTDRLKEDVEELKRIARSEGSLEDKARKAAQRLREPVPGETPAAGAAPAEDAAAAPDGGPTAPPPAH